MAKDSLSEQSLESLKKKLLIANVVAAIIGIAAIAAIVFYFIQRENSYELLIIAIGLGVALSTLQTRTANTIKKELKSRKET